MKQPWIYSATVDSLFILAPALLISTIVLLFQHSIMSISHLPVWMWGVLIVGVDVAHVYSTLFRTYADRDEFEARKTLYTLTPFICWIAGTILYSMDALFFWRAIAYLAVFHFVRQQYGFMMIYGRKETKQPPLYRHIDKAAIYLATLYPLIYWHTHLPRQFEWFIEGDFKAITATWLDHIAFAMYVVIMGLYLLKEIGFFIRNHSINLPKNALLLGTALSWWVGIVVFDNDLAFTAVNVLAHGIPYIALIWIYGRNQASLEPKKSLVGKLTFQRFFSWPMIPLFIGILVLFAYVEEGLWDGLIWAEHKSLFAPFHFLPSLEDKETLAWLVPLLALPQLTHYALDAFIWRMKTPDTNWKRILFYRNEQTS